MARLSLLCPSTLRRNEPIGSDREETGVKPEKKAPYNNRHTRRVLFTGLGYEYCLLSFFHYSLMGKSHEAQGNHKVVFFSDGTGWANSPPSPSIRVRITRPVPFPSLCISYDGGSKKISSRSCSRNLPNNGELFSESANSYDLFENAIRFSCEKKTECYRL